MSKAKPKISIAIETSCRVGGLAVGADDTIIASECFDATRRHATVLIARMDALLRAGGFGPGDIDEVYVSAGPGSFTGIRVGVTVARTLAQACPSVRCVCVHTPQAVAENTRDMDWQHLAVILAAKGDSIYTALFERSDDGEIVPAGQAEVMSVTQLVERAPRPLLVTGEALAHHPLTGEGITQVDESLYLPTAEGVWRVGRRLARQGKFTEYHQLLPIYSRKPEAVRLWESRNPSQ